ncbi:DNA cytosine methyltransferase, partial [Rhizobium hidalgonense]
MGRGKDDPRDLLLEGARAVDEIRPRSFVFENVVGLLHARHADHLGNFCAATITVRFVLPHPRVFPENNAVAS